jgi:hypothetical protein
MEPMEKKKKLIFHELFGTSLMFGVVFISVPLFLIPSLPKKTKAIGFQL